MNFMPKTEEEIQLDGLLSDGIYSYQVIKAEDRKSEKGNIYTSITLTVWDHDGHERIVFTNMALMKLLKHFCDVNGLIEEYKSGCIMPETFIYKSGGKVIIGTEPEKPNPNGGVYKAKNIVKDYIADPAPSKSMPLGDYSKPNTATTNGFVEDSDIPF